MSCSSVAKVKDQMFPASQESDLAIPFKAKNEHYRMEHDAFPRDTREGRVREPITLLDSIESGVQHVCSFLTHIPMPIN